MIADKRWLAGLTALALLAATGLAAAAPARPVYTEDVTDFGRTPWRTHYTPTEPEYPLGRNARAIWEVPLGLSRSQPLVVRRDFAGNGRVQTRIFHIAGDRLWALNGEIVPTPRRDGQSVESYRAQLRQEGFILWETPVEQLCKPEVGLMAGDEQLSAACALVGPRLERRPFASSQAVYAKGATAQQDVIYAGFGHPASLVALRPTDGEMLGGFIVDAGTDRGIVGAPLVFPGDVVVIGTTGDYTRGLPAEAYMIKGLAGGTASHRKIEVGGRISSSPVPIGTSAFVIAADGHPTYGGYMMAHNLNYGSQSEFSPRWAAPVRTPSGIPGESAIDDQTIYFADKHGQMWALRLDTGEMLWCRQFPGLGTCRNGPDTASAFINNGPGVDEEKVYFVFRNNQGPNQGNGQVVALNKATGSPVWTRAMGFMGNTAPVPMGCE